MRLHQAHAQQPSALHSHKVRTATMAIFCGHCGEGAAGARLAVPLLAVLM